MDNIPPVRNVKEKQTSYPSDVREHLSGEFVSRLRFGFDSTRTTLRRTGLPVFRRKLLGFGV